MNEEFGKIHYYLRENPLTTGEENRFMAGIDKKETLTQERLITLMTSKNTTVSRQEIRIVTDLMKEVLQEQILSGCSVCTDLFNARLSIKGGFTDIDDEYDIRRHHIRLNLTASAKFKKDLIHTASLEKVEQTRRIEVISKVYDYRTRSYALTFAAGDLVALRGRNLLPSEGDPRVYLRPDGTEELLPVAELHNVSEREVMFNLPVDLIPGDYRIRLIKPLEDSERIIDYNQKITLT